MYDACRALDINISELRQDFGGSDDVPAQLLHSLAGEYVPFIPGGRCPESSCCTAVACKQDGSNLSKATVMHTVPGCAGV
jgi:hypothetical protein